jgi:hypothetical protein
MKYHFDMIEAYFNVLKYYEMCKIKFLKQTSLLLFDLSCGAPFIVLIAYHQRQKASQCFNHFLQR